MILTSDSDNLSSEDIEQFLIKMGRLRTEPSSVSCMYIFSKNQHECRKSDTICRCAFYTNCIETQNQQKAVTVTTAVTIFHYNLYFISKVFLFSICPAHSLFHSKLFHWLVLSRHRCTFVILVVKRIGKTKPNQKTKQNHKCLLSIIISITTTVYNILWIARAASYELFFIFAPNCY